MMMTKGKTTEAEARELLQQAQVKIRSVEMTEPENPFGRRER